MAVGRQERAVERETSWGKTKLRVDGGHVIDVSEAFALAAGAGVGQKELESVLGVTSCFLST